MKTLCKLTYNYLKLNKKKALITIVSVILVTTLIFALGLGASIVRKNLLDSAIKSNGSHHVKFYDIDFDNYYELKENSDINEIAIMQIIDAISFDDYQVNIVNVTDNLRDYFYDLTGSYPTNSSEVIISNTLALDNNYVIGDMIGSYEIVGVFDYSTLGNGEYDYDYYAYTETSFIDTLPTTFFVTFKSTNGAYDKYISLAKSLGLTNITATGGLPSFENASINSDLLTVYGEYYLAATKFGVYALIISIFIVVSVFCILIVRNSFTISLNERKKQFGALRSIGASKKQIFKMVMIEASMVSLIGIPIGILLSFGLVSIILTVFNNILSQLIVPLHLYLYFEFIVISLIFILLTVFISALYPALKASKTSPIETARGNDVYKIKKTKENYPLIKKIFGYEGEVAYKSMRRNSSKFTSSIISLVISVVLFITFATIINYVLVNYATGYDGLFDVEIQVPDESSELITEIKAISSIDEIVIYKNTTLSYDGLDYYTDEFVNNNSLDNPRYFSIYGVDDKTYQKILNDLDIDDTYYGIMVNVTYKKDSKTNESISYSVFEDSDDITISLYTYESIYNEETEEWEYIFNSPYLTISNMYLTDEISYFDLIRETLIVNLDTYNEIINSVPDEEKYFSALYNIGINTERSIEFDQDIKKIIADNPNVNIGYINWSYYVYQSNMIALAFAFISYSILIFISLISITTVYSSMTTNIETRSKEFSVLRSVGMSKKGLNKMIVLEGTFLALKALFFSLLISIVVVWFIREAFRMMDLISRTAINPYPVKYVIIAVVTVLLLLILISIFSLNRIKKKNIVDAIKNENI